MRPCREIMERAAWSLGLCELRVATPVSGKLICGCTLGFKACIGAWDATLERGLKVYCAHKHLESISDSLIAGLELSKMLCMVTYT